MPFTFAALARCALAGAVLALSVPDARAQYADPNAELRIEQLENRLRQLTGQNEELQFRNRQLEDQLRQLQAGQPGPAPVAARPAVVPPSAQPTGAPQTGGREPAYAPPVYQTAPPPQQPAPAAAMQPPPQRQGRRSDAFDPNANPSAPGAPRALGGAPGPVVAPDAVDVGAPGGRAAGEPLDLGTMSASREVNIASPAPIMRDPDPIGALATLPPSQTPRDEFDLGYGYIQRKDYALAEQTLRDFVRKYPSDRMIADAQYWLGESLFQRQRYRDAAESFLTVTTKFDTAQKAPDALLRLGQSLAALNEKEAACAALGEVVRKYPRASGGVKQGVDREQKRIRC
jgi:tol-pal system protein YbgF